ncbi:2,3-bisphosphoglycerate-independent phosphoglycerate mutase [Hibiscus syriacus]|uniref:phosphoglycerate mutase (2,3-diphosphoglycerate-independent) n=1 Tax=Hibiscus syriacus TaxID=106335 RepID=A0A6A2Z2I1_HIBSY|nr:2,3-bisphosphoglycerate-independent phosphoglycerate mutase [Hibiscus syriacus]
MGSSGLVSWKLEDHPNLRKGKTIALIVLDDWGENKTDDYNCIHVAQTPTMDSLKLGAPEKWRLIRAHGLGGIIRWVARSANAEADALAKAGSLYDCSLSIMAHGKAVGLPTEDDMGNSEVGHNALGAGRIFAQGAKLADLASGKIYEGEEFKYIIECFEKGTLHLIGLLSDGGLLLKGASERGAKRICVHILTDGRDVLDGSSVVFAQTLENDLAKSREGSVDSHLNDWDVVKRGWDAQVLGEAPHKFTNAVEAVKKLRENANDQYLPPFVIVDENEKAVGPILYGDAVITFNFRADRMVMLAKALEYQDFDKFDRVRVPKIRYAGMLQYDGELKLPNHHLVSPPEIDRTSGEYLATVVACKAADEAVKIIIDAIEQVGIYVVTSDHGNAEDMAPGVRFRNDVPDGGLANVAATVMNLHGIVAPSDYEPTLIEVANN